MVEFWSGRSCDVFFGAVSGSREIESRKIGVPYRGAVGVTRVDLSAFNFSACLSKQSRVEGQGLVVRCHLLTADR